MPISPPNLSFVSWVGWSVSYSYTDLKNPETLIPDVKAETEVLDFEYNLMFKHLYRVRSEQNLFVVRMSVWSYLFGRYFVIILFVLLHYWRTFFKKVSVIPNIRLCL